MFSTVFLALAEDVTAVATVNANLIGVGGRGEWENWGLGGFRIHVTSLTNVGVSAANLVNNDAANTNNFRHPYTDAVMTLPGNPAEVDAKAASASLITNACYTVIGTVYSATGFNAWMGGFAHSTQDCVDFVSDGYTISGVPLFYRFVLTMTLLPSSTVGTILPANNAQVPQWSTLIAGVAPWNAAKGGVNG